MCEKCHDTGYLQGVENTQTQGVIKIDSNIAAGEIARNYRYPAWIHIVQVCPCVVNGQATATLAKISAKIPDDVKQHTLEDFRNLEHAAEALDVVEAMIAGEQVEINGNIKPGVLLYGGTGTGKSSMAYITYSHFLRLGVSCAWLDYRDLVNSIRETYGSAYRGQPLAGICQPYAAATVLIIDELGSETRGKAMFEDVLEAMRLIFHPRYNQRKVTFVTTNVYPPQLKHQFGDLVYSRMAGNCHFIEMTGIDMRAGV